MREDPMVAPTPDPRIARTGRRRRGPRRWGAALLVGALMGLTGCGGLPTNDTPRAGEPVLGQPRQVIQVRPEGPTVDASPEQIVRGFLLANVCFADSHEVARAYLTSDLASSWVPTSQILIYPRDYELVSTQDDAVEVDVPVEAVLDGDGRLTQPPSGGTRRQEFGVTQVGGQWRISEFPDDFGLLLSANAFEAQYRTAAINYLAPERDEFVPETRWFSRDEGLPTALARALLAPVPEYLADAVRTGVTGETNLVAGAVPVDPASGTATVNLQGAGLTEDPDQVRALYAQFFSTLSQAAGVRDVELQINGQPLRAPGVRGPVSSLEQVGMSDSEPVTPYAALRVGSTLTAVDPVNYALRDLPRDEREDLGLDLPAISTRWVDVAMDQAADQFAGVDGTRSTLWRRVGDKQIEREDIGEDLSAPAFDADSSLWVAGRASNGPRVWAIDTDEGISSLARPVEAPWLEPQMRIQSLALAPDGQRALIVLTDPGADADTDADAQGVTSALLSGVVRDQEGRPTSLNPPRVVAPTITSVADVSWAAEDTLALLGRQESDDEVRPYLLPVGSWLQPLQAEPGAQSFVGMPTDDGYKVALVTSDGRVLTREGAGWYPYRNGDDLIVPGP
ncbi:MAG: LpqB family beta-propeller domain-containing protein [Ornithinimicrobium sp.]